MPATGVTLIQAASQSACLVRGLALAVVADNIIGATTSTVRLEWDGLIAGLSHGDSGAGTLLPLGHQESPTCRCPILADDLLDPRPPPHVRLGAVAVPINPANEVLLTRRPRSMRTFPGAWVLPGGSVDATDESVAHAALRELAEETGIHASIECCEPATAEPFALWESCFPVSFDEWAAQRRVGEKRPAHFLISFVVVRLTDEQAATPLNLQPAECDAAVWAPLGDVANALLASGDAGASAPAAATYTSAPVQVGTPPVTGVPLISAQQLAGVYPNAHGEGVGRGHLWALRRLVDAQATRTDPPPVPSS